MSAPTSSPPGGHDASRAGGFLLAGPERRLLERLARRVPAGVTPDALTVLGALGFAVVAVGLAAGGATWWGAALVLVGLVLNWLGDSLDGTVARVRGHERPRYGYYLDHLVDAVGVSCVAAALGAGPLATAWAALALGLLYLVAEIVVLLEASVRDQFSIGFGRVGPTEARIVLAVGIVAVAVWSPPPTVAVLGTAVAPLDPVVAVALVGLGLSIVQRAAVTLRDLARLEPPPGR